MTYPIPLENEEQHTVVEWLELVGLRFTSVPNSTWTKSHRQKAMNHYTGLRAGFCDLIVLIPPERSRDGEGYFIAVEMKRRQGGKISDVQKGWLKALNHVDKHVVATVARGADEAIDFILAYLKPSPQHDSPF